jgi:hypothetical protein
MEKKEREVVRRGEDDSEEGGREVVMKWMERNEGEVVRRRIAIHFLTTYLPPSSQSSSLPLSLLPLLYLSPSLLSSEEGGR